MATALQPLLDGIRRREITVGVAGLGYVGLPLALALAEAGFHVIGVDIDPLRVEALRAGRSGLDRDIDAQLAAALEQGRLRVTTSYRDLAAAAAISICVPTPLTEHKDPDLRWVEAAVGSVREVLRPGSLVTLESTTYPGTTEEIVLPALERSGLEAGRDVFVCYSPERIDPGNRRYGLRNTPKIVAGVTPACLEAGLAFYGTVVERPVPVSSPRAAEMVKLLENTFRSVNIALANELALLCERMDIDIWEVIDAAATKPFGFMPFYPGPGTGGHCIPLDPLYLAWRARGYRFYSRFIELAADVNDGMARHVVDRVARLLNWQGKSLRNSHLLVLGLAYKRDVADTRESPAVAVLELLRWHRADVVYHDPWVPEFRTADGTLLRSQPLTAGLVRAADCVLLTTDHSGFDYRWIARQARLIFDTRGAFRGCLGDHIHRLGSPEPSAAETLLATHLGSGASGR